MSPSPPTTMDSDKREEATTVLYEEEVVRPTKKSIFVSYLKRYWWLLLLLVCCAVALAVPLLIFIGIKNIVHSKIKKATLEIQGIEVTNTQIDGFNMAINATIKGDHTKATVASFNGTMYLEDLPDHTPFASLTFPETKNKPMQAVNISQWIAVSNLDAITTFNTWLLQNESIRVTVEGNTHVTVPGISKKYPALFKKTITLAGLNKFAGMSVANTSVTASTFDDGTNFHTTLTIPNASPVSLEIGNTTFATFLEDAKIGTSYIDNVYLNRGDNVFHLRALIAPLPVLTALDEEPYCGNGSLPISISGRTVTRNDQNLTMFSDALGSTNNTLSIPLADAFAAIGIDVGCPSSSSS